MPYLIFDDSSGGKGASTSESDEKDAHPSWLVGLPRVRGFFGHHERTEFAPGHEVTTKGGTTSGTLLRWHERIVERIYPNITPDWHYEEEGEVDADGLMPIKSGPIVIKTDMGPDRVDMQGREQEGCQQEGATRRHPNPKRLATSDFGRSVFVPSGLAARPEWL